MPVTARIGANFSAMACITKSDRFHDSARIIVLECESADSPFAGPPRRRSQPTRSLGLFLWFRGILVWHYEEKPKPWDMQNHIAGDAEIALVTSLIGWIDVKNAPATIAH